MKKKILLILMMFLFVTNVKALTFNVDVTNIEDKGSGSLGTITKIDIPNKEVDALFEDIGAEVKFSVTVTNTGDRAGTLRSIDVKGTNDKMEYTTDLPEGGLSINGNDTNVVTITAKVKEGAVNGKTSSEIKIKYNYDEGSCPEGEILSEDESMCLCPTGKVRTDKGICEEPPKPVECKDDEVYNTTTKQCEKKVVPVVPDNPKTLDNIILVTLLFIVSGLGIYAVMFKRLKTTKKKVTAGVLTGVATLTLSFTVLAGVFGIDNLLGAIVNPITKSKEIKLVVNEEIDLIETWDGECSLDVSELTPENIFQGGSGTENDPYQIKTAEQLSCFAKSINNGTTYQDQYVKQIKDIKLNDNLNDQAASGDLSNAHLWTTAGYTENTHDDNWNWFRIGNGFFGTYNGDNHTISGLYLTDDSVHTRLDYDNYVGLFAYAKNATFKNMKFTDTYINTKEKTATLLGYGYENLTLSNITTYGTGIFVDSREGYSAYDGAGVVSNYEGHNMGTLTIENVTNNMNLTCGGSCSGIIHRVSGFGETDEYNMILKDLTNNGNLTFIDSPSGTSGIMGYCDNGWNTLNALIDNNANNGNLVFDFASNETHGGGVGGLYGYFTARKVKMTNTYNTGNITGFNSLGYFGGIASRINVKDELIVDKCWNSGDMIATYVADAYRSYAAGLIGGSDSDDARIIITNSFNTGDIDSPNSGYVAGIMGKFEEYSYYPESDPERKIEDCYNTGNFTGWYALGGMAGQFSGEINRCYNTGDFVVLKDPARAGGIVGYGAPIISYCYNTGDITIKSGGPLAGGICSADCNVSNSYNRGNITLYNVGGDIGGINGQYGTITNSYNSGNIVLKNRIGAYVSGIGYNGTHTNVYNLGNITAEDAILPYGQLAGISTGGNDTNAVNTGNITINVQNPFTEAGRFQIAGIQAYSSTAKNCFNAGTITISDDILNDGLAHEFQVGEIGSSSTSSSSGNKWNTNPNSNALGCVTATGYSACTIEQSQAVGSYVNEEAPDILSIINGDDAFEIKDGDSLPTLKVFN